MASEDRALRRLASADPVPPGGPELVRYMGGTGAAAQVLSGLDGPPPTSLKRTDPERYAEQRTRWRTASRQAQRWARGESRKGLSDTERRRAQRVNRERKRTAARVSGIRVQVQGARIVITSSASLRTDSRTRSILHDPSGQLGVLVTDPAIMDAVQRGDLAEARELLEAGFIVRAGLPGEELSDGRRETDLRGGSWVLWVDGEPVPEDAER